MQRSAFDRILLVLILTGVLFGVYAVVTALDRQSRALIELRRAIEAMPASGAAPMAAAKTQAASGAERSPNARYYPPAAEAGGRFRTAASAEAGTLNPVTGNDAFASRILSLCTSPLGGRDLGDPSQFVPMIAESWQVSPDGKTITIHLRRGVLWQPFTDPESGKKVPSREVTAGDFLFYVNTIRDPEVNAGALRSYYQDLESVTAPDAYTLVLRWKNEYFRSLELSLGMIPLPRHFYCPDDRKFDAAKFNDDHLRNQMIVGCGPYQLTERVRNQYFLLKRFHGYFGEALGIAPALETRRIEIIEAENARFQMLLSGELDQLSLSPDQWRNRAAQKPFSQSVLAPGQSSEDMPLAAGETLRRIQYLASSYYYIGYNLRNPLFADRRVRQALTMLCNRERILRDVYFGEGKVISGPFFYDSPYYDRSIAPWPFDVTRAKALLAEAGWRDADGDGILEKDGRKFVFTAMQVSGNPMQEKLLSIFKEDLAKAGIDMKIAVFEWPVYIEKLEKRSYEVCSLGWALPYESDPYQVWHSSQADEPSGSNHIGFKNAEADRLIEEIRRTFDVTKRIDLCHRLHKLLHEEQPYTFLLVPEALEAIAGRFRNVRCFPLGPESECFYVPASERIR